MKQTVLKQFWPRSLLLGHRCAAFSRREPLACNCISDPSKTPNNHRKLI